MTLIKRIRQWLKGIRENETKNSKRGAIKKGNVPKSEKIFLKFAMIM